MAAFSVSKDSGYSGGLDQLLNCVNRLPTRDKADFEVQVVEEEPAEELDRWPKPNGAFITQQAARLRISLCCRVCGKKDVPARFVLCSGCGAAHMPAHRQCLLNTRDHKPEDEEPPEFGDPCEEIDFQQWIFVSWLVDSKIPDKENATLHINDLWSTWFGVPEDQEGRFPQLCIYPRLERLIEKVLEKPKFQYPSLISFVGDTGSGKSTLIRAIVESLAPGQDYQVPVQGVAKDKFKSTSSDVRLFADPQTQSSEVPRFFVDCEGFNGSDNPVSRKIISEAREARRSSQVILDGALLPSPPDPITQHKGSALNRIDLRWGQLVLPVDVQGGGGRRQLGQVSSDTRSNVVKLVYPRLLYAFSDVVCFVTTNSRQSHEILERMFHWAKDGHERTLNQRARPGLIIVLNKMSMDTHETIWTAEKETRQLLDSFEHSTRFQELQRKWEIRGRPIKTAEELIRCYYDDFRVISIPQLTRSSPAIVQNISDQIKALYSEIIAMSEKIRGKRKSFNLDLDTSSLNAYLHRSAMALGRDYRDSLDFHELSDGDVAPPRRFSEHLAQLMARMAKQRNFDTIQAVKGESQLVLQMTPYIAACIVAQIDPKGGREHEQKRKEALVDEAKRGLEQFRNRSWRCEEQDHRGERRCRNYFESHEKGHQFEAFGDNSHEPDASVENLVVGVYKSSYDPAAFIDRLWEELSEIRDRAHSISRLASAATNCNVTGITTQRTCLACLSNAPTNMLPCTPHEHGICEDCIRRYNPRTGEASVIRMNACPLGCLFSTTPWNIRVKPRTAGARILALDGGGVRGIVELVILAKIEKAVGFGIRIQDLFDLVIGTSTGGLVALGVFEKKWPLSDAIDHFSRLAKEAFSLRKVLALPGLSLLAEPFCVSKYKSSGINNALRTAFGDDYLFGQIKGGEQSGDQVKVGVVTCLDGHNHPCLLANYSRNPIEKLKDGREANDCLQRSDEQGSDFQTWAAARATSAAQTLFKPYIHEATRRVYVDGATVRNNPVRLAAEEATRIWKSSSPPDIIVSLGTGIWIDEKCKYVDKPPSKIGRLLPKGIKKKIETGIDMVYATLDCDREWTDFSGPLRGRYKRNCHRLNIGLYEKPPALDDIEQLVNLRVESEIIFSRNEVGLESDHVRDRQFTTRDHTTIVAQHLVASLFYLSRGLPTTMHGGCTQCTLHCRLPPDSVGAAALTRDLNESSFRIREVSDAGEVVKPVRFLADGFHKATMSVEVELDISDGSCERFVEVRLPQSLQGMWHPIGGF
ncbi:hypothetical protein MRS44_011419 [Fusarium solani]|uniref:uncharacterized protein n=1 Tax=Fusarium solani TaxID=169388 RepID=UPI0032C45A7D|nr:hypothetical protein MRS44_011419 [Fusarium solani]